MSSVQLNVSKPGLSAKLAPPKKEVRSTKGVQSAAVKAFLEKREKEEKDKGEYFLISCVIFLIFFVLHKLQSVFTNTTRQS